MHFEGRNCEEVKLMMIHCRKTNKKCKISVEIERAKPNIEDLIELADIAFIGKDFIKSKELTNLSENFNSFL